MSRVRTHTHTFTSPYKYTHITHMMVLFYTLSATWFVSLPHETIIMFAYFSYSSDDFPTMFQFRSVPEKAYIHLVWWWSGVFAINDSQSFFLLCISKYFANFCCFYGVLCVCNEFSEWFYHRSSGTTTVCFQHMDEEYSNNNTSDYRIFQTIYRIEYYMVYGH